MTSYVKEVQDVINLGIIDEETTLKLYENILRNFLSICSSPNAESTQATFLDIRKNERNWYHELIDKVCNRYDSRLSWRNVKFEPKRVKRCIVCQSYYYDKARNGKTLTCDQVPYKEWSMEQRKYRYRHDKYGNKMSNCAVELDKRRRAAPDDWTEDDIIYPHSKRRVSEESVDMQPSANDARGNAILQEMQIAYNDL